MAVGLSMGNGFGSLWRQPPMSSLVYAINIATLALWLGLAGLDGVAWLLPIWHVPAKSSRAGETAALLSVPEISLGAPEASATVSDPVREPADIPPPDALPKPPQIPQIADFPPLPEVPEVSVPATPSISTDQANQLPLQRNEASKWRSKPAKMPLAMPGRQRVRPAWLPEKCHHRSIQRKLAARDRAARCSSSSP